MAKQQLMFAQRLNLLARKHEAMSRGYVTRIQPDGLIVAHPRRRPPRLPRPAIFVFLLAFFVFKAFLVASLGSQAYDDRLARLQAGTAMEKGGSFIMQADPLTMFLAKQIGPILR